MKRSLLMYLTAVILSLVLLGGCASSGAGEGSTNGSQKDQAAEGTTAEKKHIKLSADKLMEDLDYDPASWAKLPDNYDRLELKVEGDFEYKEENFKQMIDQMLSSFTTYEDTDKKVVEDGDVVNIDYEGKVDGKTFEGGSAQGQDLEIGSGSFIEGFEEGLIGKKVGETVDLNLQFPKEYTEELAGKKVTFTVTINSIKKTVVTTYDTLTDEFVKENMGAAYGYETKEEYLKDYEKFYKEDLENQKKQAIMSAYNTELYDKTDFSGISKDALDKEYKKNMDLLEGYAKENGMKLDEYLESAGVDKDSYRKQFEENYKHTIMYQSLIKAMNYTLDQTEADEEIQNYIGSYGIPEEEFYKQFGSKEEVYRQIAYSHVMEEMADTLESNNVITYSKPEDNKTEAGDQQIGRFNTRQTIFVSIGLICLLLAIVLAILQIQENIKAKQAQNDLDNKMETEGQGSDDPKAEGDDSDEKLDELGEQDSDSDGENNEERPEDKEADPESDQ